MITIALGLNTIVEEACDRAVATGKRFIQPQRYNTGRIDRLSTAMNPALDLTDLTPDQIEQIYKLIETFRATNKQQKPVSQKATLSFDPTPLFFESDILQPFNRSLRYGNRA